MSNNFNIINIKNICHSYRTGDTIVKILNNAELSLKPGTSNCLIGNSGCGKTTLMQIMGLILKPNKGEVFVEGDKVNFDNSEQINQILKNSISTIHQFHYLINDFTVIENVMMPMKIQGIPKEEAKKRAMNSLEKVGMSKRANDHVNDLSGGEQQRVSVARAIAKNPKLILADEPTGNLDPTNAKQVFKLMLQCAKDYKAGIFCITHNQELAQNFDNIFTIKDNAIVKLN